MKDTGTRNSQHIHNETLEVKEGGTRRSKEKKEGEDIMSGSSRQL